MEINSIDQAFEWFRTKGWKTNTFPQQVTSLPNDGHHILQPISMGTKEEFSPRLHNPANQTPLLHSHEDFVLMYMYSGACQTYLNDMPLLLNTGDVLIISPHVMHSNVLVSNDDIMFHCTITRSLLCNVLLPLLSGDVLFSSFIMTFLSDQRTDEHLYFAEAGKDDRVKKAFENLLFAYIDRQPLHTSYVRSMLAVFITLLGITHAEKNKAETKMSREMNTILDYITRNFSHVNLIDVAKLFHYHPNYLSSIIKNETGKTFTELITSYRLSRAYYLLSSTDISISTIAASVGYHDLSNFYRAYKKYFGVTPSSSKDGIDPLPDRT